MLKRSRITKQRDLVLVCPADDAVLDGSDIKAYEKDYDLTRLKLGPTAVRFHCSTMSGQQWRDLQISATAMGGGEDRAVSLAMCELAFERCCRRVENWGQGQDLPASEWMDVLPSVVRVWVGGAVCSLSHPAQAQPSNEGASEDIPL